MQEVTHRYLYFVIQKPKNRHKTIVPKSGSARLERFLAGRVGPRDGHLRCPSRAQTKRLPSEPFCVCVCLLLSAESLKESTAEHNRGGRLRGGALGSLPCWGFLFLLVTRRSSRTGLPRPACAGGKHWEARGKHTTYAASQNVVRHCRAERRPGTQLFVWMLGHKFP